MVSKRRYDNYLLPCNAAPVAVSRRFYQIGRLLGLSGSRFSGEINDAICPSCCKSISFTYRHCILSHLVLLKVICVTLHHESRKQDTKLFHITSPNVNWFSKFFRWQTQWWIWNKVILIIPPHLKYVTTLPFEIYMFRKISVIKN